MSEQPDAAPRSLRSIVSGVISSFRSFSPGRKVLIFAGLFCFILICNLVIFRIIDRDAWPEPVRGVVLDIAAPEFTDTESNAWIHLERLMPGPTEPQQPSDALFDELEFFDAYGFTVTNGYALLERESAAALEKTNAWLAAASAPVCVPRPDNLKKVSDVLMRAMQFSRLYSYFAAKCARDGNWAEYTEFQTASLAIAKHVMRNQGIMGLFVSLNISSGVSRDIFLHSCEYSIPAGTADVLAGALSDTEMPKSALPDALRTDRALAFQALDSLFISNSEVAPEKKHNHPPKFAVVMAEFFGSSHEVSSEHLDSICSKAISTAEAPFKFDAFFDGMPKWCRLGSRAPWSRDPFGALAASMFIRNIAASFAYPPLQKTEIRAAITALRLNGFRNSSPGGEWPCSLDALIDDGPSQDQPAEFITDPFSGNGSAFLYKVDDKGIWTLTSAGLDMTINPPPAADTSVQAAQDKTDIIYTSDERNRRKTEYKIRQQETNGKNGLPSAPGNSTI